MTSRRATGSRRANVVGSGPNGLAAAITLARAGWQVVVYEAAPTPGGGLSSAALTLPGFVHDRGSAIHPLAAASPFFRTLPLHRHGLEWVQPALPLAHPLPGDPAGAALFHRSLEQTAAGLGRDEAAYLRLMRPLVERWEPLLAEFLQPLLHLPAHPLLLARFGLRGLPPASLLARLLFRDAPARALFAGLAAHSGLPLSSLGTSAFGLMLAVAGHAVGWPFPRGGAQALTGALVAHLNELGGELRTSSRIDHLSDLPPGDATLLDVSPAGLLALAGDTLPPAYAAQLRRFRPGPGAFKVDYALSGPVPWQDARVGAAGTVHLGGPLAAIEQAERAPGQGRTAPRPYVLVAQQSGADPSRAPAGQHTLWAYSHVPGGQTGTAPLAALEGMLEQAAPGFGATVLARHVSTPAVLQAWNANLLGGDVGGGANTLRQLLARPVLSPSPYRTPLPGVYLCSASTPPGGGVHGMAGHLAARLALRER